MNSFRDSILGGANSEGPLLPAKKPKGSPDSDSGLLVPRAETRTSNQRGESRDVLSAEEARLKVGRRNYVVDLINLSGGGAMIGTNVPLKLWQQVHLELGESGSVECAVRWLKGDRVGLEFAHETQVGGDSAKRDAMLLETIERNFPDIAEEATEEADGEFQERGSQRRSGRRHPLIWSGAIHFDHDTTSVRLRNISDSGALVESERPYPEGAELLLDLGGAGQHFAIVSWSRGDQVGLKFREPFDIACLANARPEVTSHLWKEPTYFGPGEDRRSPWAEGWDRLSLPELKTELEGFLKR